MVYISNGQVLDNRSRAPWSLSSITDFFWSIADFVVMLFPTAGSTGFEYLQRRIHSLSGPPVPVLHHSHSREGLPCISMELPMFQFVLLSTTDKGLENLCECFNMVTWPCL
uniref:Selenoprotein K n=1 Tax=Pavo cristatus TaxID=9049 RepID=A0A8C9EZP6_PAVCR